MSDTAKCATCNRRIELAILRFLGMLKNHRAAWFTCSMPDTLEGDS